MDLELNGKAVLITGGTDGLGLALAKRLAAEGASVAVCGRDPGTSARRRDRVDEIGGEVLAQQADVTRPADLHAFVEAAMERWGRIDGIVHNAGRAAGGPIQSIEDAAWESDFQLKLMAARTPDPTGAARVARDAGIDSLHACDLGQGTRRVERTELGHPCCGHGTDEGPFQGARPRRCPGQRRVDRSDRERPVGTRCGGHGGVARGVLRTLRQGRCHSALGRFGQRRRVRRPGLFLVVAPRVLSDRGRDQPRRRAFAGRLTVRRCSPPSRYGRPEPPFSRPIVKPSIMSSRVSASTCARPSPPHFALAARRAETTSSATTNTTSWSSPIRPSVSSPPRNAA